MPSPPSAGVEVQNGNDKGTITRWDRKTLWKISALTGKISKLKDDATDSAASPDGHEILYMDPSSRELWLMGPDGEGAHRIMAVGPSEEFSGLAWAPNSRRFAYLFDAWTRAIDAWSPDSHTIYFSSDRTGKYAIYRQEIDQRVAEQVVAGGEDYYAPRLSANHNSLFFTASAKRGTAVQALLMKMPLDGGTASVLATGEYEYQCASPSSKVCIVSQTKGNQLLFYALDPDQGPGAVPLVSSGPVLDWSLSPDGQQIALIDRKDQERVQLFLLGNHTARTLDLGKWSHVSAQLQSVRWFPNGRGLYVTAFLPSGTTLLSISLDGNASVLAQGHNWLCCLIPANGKILGYSLTEIQRDLALIENL